MLHAIPFHTKRAHLSMMRFMRPVVGRFRDMTPARYDVMRALRDANWRLKPEDFDRPISQQYLVKELALHKSVISKTLRTLRKLGWVETTVDYDDRRRRLITMTARGFRAIRRAMRWVDEKRVMLEQIEAYARARHPKFHVLKGVDRIRKTIDGLARWFGDSSLVFYDYGSKSEYPPSLRHPLRRYSMADQYEMHNAFLRGETDVKPFFTKIGWL